MSNMYVTNRWNKPVVMSYCFVSYEFPVGQTVEVPLDAARHIFGFDEDDKEPYMVRLGWIRTKNDYDESVKIYDRFEFSSEPPKKNHSLSPVVEKVPLPNARRAGGTVQANA
jgi:hypothetical protein